MLRNAPTALMKNLGYHAGYLYNPDVSKDQAATQTYLPDSLKGRRFFDYREHHPRIESKKKKKKKSRRAEEEEE
jgi:putative ATPase